MYRLEHSPGRTVIANGKEYLFFSGYSYLGMSHVPEFVELVKQGIDKFGVLHPSSRISNTRSSVYNEFEKILSTITGFESAVSFSSGFLAGRAIAELLASKNDCFILPNTHPALQAKQKIFRGSHNDLIDAINSSPGDRITIFGDSVNPLTVAINNFSFLQRVNSNKIITCIIDDSHGIGLLGKNGEGISSLLQNQSNVEYVITYSLSKALHINGGAISCNNNMAELLRNLPAYTASTAIAPYMAYAFINCQHLYIQQLQRLQQNILFFSKLIKDIRGVSYHSQLPIFILAENFSEDLFDKHQMIISSFSYPDPLGKKIKRIVLNALHTNNDLVRLADVIKKIGDNS